MPDLNYKFGEFNYNKVLIFGYSKSGKSAEKLLQKLDCNYTIFDDNLKVSGGRFLTKLNKTNLASFNLIVLSPGVSIYHKKIVLAKKLGVKVVSELEFAYWFCTPKIIAVTGTNGKTTVVNLLNHTLKIGGFKSEVFGNVGQPLSEVIYYKNLDYAVVEVSSFQLEAIDSFKAEIAMILNLEQDHIDRHKTVKNYYESKIKLFKNSGENDVSLVNYDDINLALLSTLLPENRVYASKNSQNANVYIKNESVIICKNNECKAYVDVSSFKHLQTHEINILFVAYVAARLNISGAKFKDSMQSFLLSEHRCEYVNSVGGVDYINDSKATNLHATVFAVGKQTKPTVLLLGGVNKKLSFAMFFKQLPKNVVAVICFGASGKKIYSQAKKCGVQNLHLVIKMKDAVLLASKIAKQNECVLLSPACTSFDEFLGYDHRGKVFREIVAEIKLGNVE